MITLDAREGGIGSPRIGAVVGIGEPGVTPTAVRVDGAIGAGDALYKYVELSTMEEPATKAKVIG